MRPMPVIVVSASTRVTHQCAPWRRWVTIRRGRGIETARVHVFDPPFRRIPSERETPVSRRRRDTLYAPPRVIPA